MSWDGLYVHQRNYKIFEEGDEVCTYSKKYKSLIIGKSYTVIKCFNPYPHLPDTNARQIVILNELGEEQSYASYHFEKSPIQLRDDKIKSILNT